MLVVEGVSVLGSFFGYHNLQRFSSVVNDHRNLVVFPPVMWWPALPFTPRLVWAWPGPEGTGKRGKGPPGERVAS